MSQSVPPPGNPFADDAVGHPPAQPVPVRADNVTLGVVAAVVAALVAAGIYGGIAGAIEREIGWAAIGVGFVTGLAAGRVGGRNPVLPLVSGAVAVGAVYLGQLTTIAVVFGKEKELSATDILFHHFGGLTDVWSETADAMSIVFFALAAYAAWRGAKKAAR